MEAQLSEGFWRIRDLGTNLEEKLSRARREASVAKTRAEVAERKVESRIKAPEVAFEAQSQALAELAEGSFTLLTKVMR